MRTLVAGVAVFSAAKRIQTRECVHELWNCVCLVIHTGAS